MTSGIGKPAAQSRVVDAWTGPARRAAAGDRRALEELIGLAQADVWRYCVAFVGPGDADDTAQDALLRVVRSVHGFRGDAPARVWVMAITRHTCLDAIRLSVRRRQLDAQRREVETIGTPSGEGLVDLADLLARLDEDRRDAFVLTQVVGLSYLEAAAACGCPVGTIRSRVARARLQLVGELEPSENSVAGEPG